MSSDGGGAALGVPVHFLTAALSRTLLGAELSDPILLGEKKKQAMSFIYSYTVDTFLYLLQSRSSKVHDASAPKGETKNSQEHVAPGEREHRHSSCPAADSVVSPSVWGSVSVCVVCVCVSCTYVPVRVVFLCLCEYVLCLGVYGWSVCKGFVCMGVFMCIVRLCGCVCCVFMFPCVLCLCVRMYVCSLCLCIYLCVYVFVCVCGVF